MVDEPSKEVSEIFDEGLENGQRAFDEGLMKEERKVRSSRLCAAKRGANARRYDIWVGQEDRPIHEFQIFGGR